MSLQVPIIVTNTPQYTAVELVKEGLVAKEEEVCSQSLGGNNMGLSDDFLWGGANGCQSSVARRIAGGRTWLIKCRPLPTGPDQRKGRCW